MTTYDVLLIVQYITVGTLFLEMWIVFAGWKNTVHSYLLFTCLASFIANLGYLFEMQAGSEESFITALKFSYAGRVWIVFAFFLFASKICNIKVPRWLFTCLVIVHIGVYASILAIGHTGLFYSDVGLDFDSAFPIFTHRDGIVHDFWLLLDFVLIVFSIVWVINAFRLEKNKNSRRKFLMIILAFAVQALSFVLQVTGALPISEYYDLTMPGTFIGTVFMLIAILKLDLLGAEEIARDFVIDRIEEGIIALDNNGKIRYYNVPISTLYPEFDVFFKKKKAGSSIFHRKGKTTVTPYDIVDDIEAAVRSEDTLKIGDRIFTAEKNVLTQNGENYGKIFVLTDDTEHYRYMDELQKQRDIADSANEAKSKFLASMSHEIRTPINAVLGLDEMILRETSEKETRAYAGDIMSAGRTLLSLINDILDLSKVEEGKMEIIPVEYNLKTLVNDLLNMIRSRAEKKGLSLIVNVDSNIPNLLIGDEIRLRQCVMNLLTNAVKYTEEGEVTLSFGYKESDSNHIFLTVNVEDTGIGMKKEDMDRLFSPYARIEEKRNRTIEGTGLGMSITRQLLELMGSELKVSSEYGKGSVFSFEVSQEVASSEPIGDYSEGLSSPFYDTFDYHEMFHAPDAKILVVDDTEMNLTVIKSLLKKTLISIDTAMSGKDAIELANATSYDVVFIDHMMPDMDGIETLSHIRDSGASKDSPAVALTANAVSGARQMYLDAGFNDYLSKPIESEKLEKMLCDLLPESKIRSVDSGSVESTGNASGSASDNGSYSDITSEYSSEAQSQWIYEIPGVDAKAGIDNCGSLEGYLSVLSVFHTTAETKADEIGSLYNEGDIDGFTIKVHALKSSARIIGASTLSKKAEAMENAGKNGDREYIDSNVSELISLYREVDKSLGVFDKNDEDRPDISASEMEDAYKTIQEIAESMDYGLMENVLDRLREYKLPTSDEERIERIERLLTELDWDGIISEVVGR